MGKNLTLARLDAWLHIGSFSFFTFAIQMIIPMKQILSLNSYMVLYLKAKH